MHACMGLKCCTIIDIYMIWKFTDLQIAIYHRALIIFISKIVVNICTTTEVVRLKKFDEILKKML